MSECDSDEDEYQYFPDSDSDNDYTSYQYDDVDVITKQVMNATLTRVDSPPTRPAQPLLPTISQHPLGLINKNNWCFLNAPIQVLAHIPELRNQQKEHANATGIASDFTKLARDLHNSSKNTKCVDHSEFVAKCAQDVVSFKSLHGGLNHVGTTLLLAQEDCYEFLMQLRDKIACLSLFEGSMVSIRTCNSCPEVSLQQEKAHEIFLSFEPGNTAPRDTINAALDRYFLRSEDVNLDCTACLGDTFKQEHELKSWGPILTLMLRRFESISSSQQNKIDKFVGFEQYLNMKPYLAQSNQRDDLYFLYSLFAVIVHQGTSMNSGHYIVYLRDAVCDQWYCMNVSLL